MKKFWHDWMCFNEDCLVGRVNLSHRGRITPEKKLRFQGRYGDLENLSNQIAEQLESDGYNVQAETPH